MYNIEMKKVTEFDGFDPREFCVKPSYWRYNWVHDYDIPDEYLAEAKNLAKEIDGICVAVIIDNVGEYVIGQSCCSGCSSKFLLFNAAVTTRPTAEVRAITYNTGTGALTRYWYDKWLKYEPGSIV